MQTYLHPERKWVIHNYRIFYYRGFDAAEKMMIEPWVFEIDPKTFRLVRGDQRQPRALAAQHRAMGLGAGHRARHLRRG